jgi:hypothetical protein
VIYEWSEYSVPISVSETVAAAWEQVLSESPDPYDEALLDPFFGGPSLTYRERLHRQRRNVRRELIPRIVTVRRNLAMLGKPRRKPQLPP